MSSVEYCRRLRSEICRLFSSLPVNEQSDLLTLLWDQHEHSTGHPWSPELSPATPPISDLGTLIVSLISARNWDHLEHLEIFQNQPGTLVLALRLSVTGGARSPTSEASEITQDILK